VNKHQTMKAYWGNGGKNPHSLHFGTERKFGVATLTTKFVNHEMESM